MKNEVPTLRPFLAPSDLANRSFSSYLQGDTTTTFVIYTCTCVISETGLELAGSNEPSSLYSGQCQATYLNKENITASTTTSTKNEARSRGESDQLPVKKLPQMTIIKYSAMGYASTQACSYHWLVQKLYFSDEARYRKLFSHGCGHF